MFQKRQMSEGGSVLGLCRIGVCLPKASGSCGLGLCSPAETQVIGMVSSSVGPKYLFLESQA